MVFSIVLLAVICIGIVVTSIVFPSFKIGKVKLNLYWLLALVGAIIALSFQLIPINEWWEGLTKDGSINPLQILILFISMTIISIFLDEVGFFSFLAEKVVKLCKKSQYSIFIGFYILIAILTMFTSNDIVILTLTPFIIAFCKNAKISPIPYLVAEFVCANTWSMMFIIGNPTNIYIATSFDISFVQYLKDMWLPTILAGLVEFGILCLIFRSKLIQPINNEDISETKINKPLTIIGLIVLITCTAFLIASSYVNLPMYIISAISLGVLTISVLLYALIKKEKPKELLKSYARGPYELIPFLLGMFTLVLALDKTGATKEISQIFTNESYWGCGYLSFICANAMNNIPMSVTFTSIISNICSGPSKLMYSAIIGSNIGAFLTPCGALAGIMWMNILKRYDVKFSYLDFIKYCGLIGVIVMTVALAGLALVSL